jgi:hypothetical protein
VNQSPTGAIRGKINILAPGGISINPIRGKVISQTQTSFRDGISFKFNLIKAVLLETSKLVNWLSNNSNHSKAALMNLPAASYGELTPIVIREILK